MNEAKKSFVERIMEHLKGGEKSKLGKFQKGTVKYLDTQVRLIQERIEKNEDLVEEKLEELGDYILEVSFDKIAKTELRSDYIKNYVQGYDDRMDVVEGLKEEIEDDKALIKRREELKKVIK